MLLSEWVSALLLRLCCDLKRVHCTFFSLFENLSSKLRCFINKNLINHGDLFRFIYDTANHPLVFRRTSEKDQKESREKKTTKKS